MGLVVVMAQLAPVVLFPIFYNRTAVPTRLAAAAVVLSERAGTRVRGVYRWKLSEKSRKANGRSHRPGRHAAHHSGRHAA